MPADKSQYRLTICNNSLSKEERERIVTCASLAEAQGIAHDWAENCNPAREDDSDETIVVTVCIEVDTSEPEDAERDWLEVAEMSVEVLG